MHQLDYVFQADGADISKRVHEFRFFYGLRGFSTHSAPLLSRARARLVLANDDGYWTDDRLDGISQVTMDVDSTRMVTLRRRRWERARRKRVIVNLISTLDYEADASFHAYQDDLDENELLTAVGMTITPATTWEGWTVDNGGLWTGNRYNFLRLFGTHANAMICEDGNGAVRALLPQTDTRMGTERIDFSTYNILGSTIKSARLNTWQRNAQNYSELDYTLHRRGHLDFGALTEWRNFDGIPNTEVARQGNQIRAEFDLESIAESGLQPANFHALVCRADFWSSGNPGTQPIFRSNGVTWTWDGRFLGVVGRHGVISPNAERCAVWLSRADGTAPTDSDVQNLEIYGITRIAAYWTYDNDFTRTRQVIKLQNDSDDYLPDMPWDAGSNAVSKFEGKLGWHNMAVGRMTGLEFHQVQKSQAAWASLLALTLASTVELALLDGDFVVAGQAHPIAHTWHYRAQGLSTLTVDFLSYRELEARGIAFEDPDQLIYFESTDQPIERDPV